jgi:hypothetical protein
MDVPTLITALVANLTLFALLESGASMMLASEQLRTQIHSCRESTKS